MSVFDPPLVDRGARCTDRAPECPGQSRDHLEVLWTFQATSAGDYDLRLGDIDLGACTVLATNYPGSTFRSPRPLS